MKEQKSFIVDLAETIDRHLPKRDDRERRSSILSRGASHPVLRSLMPNIGTLLLVAVLILTQNVWARQAAGPAAPGPSATTINYQGRLANNDGTPLTEDGVAMGFAIYDAEEGGNLIWPTDGKEDHVVDVSDGLFSVGLGSKTSGGIPTTTWNGDRYLEIAVGGETLAPRELIRSVPIAGMALTVPDGAIGTDQVADGAITPTKAPSLLETIPENSMIQYGEAHTTATEDTWTLDIEIVFPHAFGDRPRVVVMPRWNHTKHPVLVIRPSECDANHCVIHVSQSSSGTWSAGQVQWIDWIAIGPKN